MVFFLVCVFFVQSWYCHVMIFILQHINPNVCWNDDLLEGFCGVKHRSNVVQMKSGVSWQRILNVTSHP